MGNTHHTPYKNLLVKNTLTLHYMQFKYYIISNAPIDPGWLPPETPCFRDTIPQLAPPPGNPKSTPLCSINMLDAETKVRNYAI